MKTFADYLPTMTAREREIATCVLNHILQCEYEPGLYCIDEAQKMEELMSYTPPAKEPVSVDGVIVWEDAMTLCRHVRLPNHEPGTIPAIKVGDRVRVVKIEEMK